MTEKSGERGRGRARSPREGKPGGASWPERSRGKGVPDTNEKAASRRTQPIPGQESRKSSLKSQSNKYSRRRLLKQTSGLGMQNEAGNGALPVFPLSTPTPLHSLCHTTLFSPLSATGGAIFPTLRNSSHHLPLPTYLGRGSGGGPAPSCGLRPPGISAHSRTEAAQHGWNLCGKLLSPEVRRPLA
ncbi:hypothetical protein P7K49_016400 [Saguinus oedipus]|uniref:Uncharacterized protein n=1 Tax=Saguinus oedipus TaxID=9490 RepID=A0ABQ9VBY1_SAGOE|nr:hypothetical protein P7K49_016400 [Saguinus oedipus]